jgi:cytosine/adenosine deaminase-related metal-dependent hydrolase
VIFRSVLSAAAAKGPRFVAIGLALMAAGSTRGQTAPPDAAGRLLVRNGIMFTLKEGNDQPRKGYLLAGADGRILQVGSGEPPAGMMAATVVDATGKFVVPGFVSAHNHIYQSVMRGLAMDQTLFGWIDGALTPIDSLSTPEDRYYATIAGCFDLLRHGITSAFNFNDAEGVPGLDREALRGELDSGIRFVHAYCLPFTGTRESRLKDFEAFYSYSRAFADRPTFLAVGLGGYSCSTDDRSYALLEGEIMRRYGFYNEAHYQESPDTGEVAAENVRFRGYVESGELGPHLCFGHFIHADDDILRQVSAAGAGMVWNPLSNGRLASGVADIPKYRKLGIRIGMGVDGQASADLADPFENMRTGLYLIRAKYQDARILQPRDVLRFHTLGSADVIGVADRVGSLEPGKYADFLVIDPHAMETGPVYDPCGTLVLACGTPNIAQVYVGGRLLVDHGECQNPIFARVNAEANRRFHVLGERAAVTRAPGG